MSAKAAETYYQQLIWPLTVILLWFFCHPYAGIDHDARVYTLMAMRWLDESAFARDPWFAFGSQDDWTIFSPIYAAVLSGFGVANGAFVVSVAGGACLGYASWFFARALLREVYAPLLALVMVSVPICYSPARMFFIMETYATARPFAIAASLMALGGLFWKSRTKFVIWSVLAFLLHPIMALAPAAVGVLLNARDRVRVAICVLAVICVAMILLLGHVGYVPTVAADWSAYLDESPLIFISSWLSGDVATHIFWLSLLVLGGCYGRRRLVDFYSITLLVTLGAVLVTVLCEVLSPVTLLLQAQFWRAIWFAKIVGLVVVVDLVSKYLLHGAARDRWVFAGGVCAVAASGPHSGWVLAAITIGCLLFPIQLSSVLHRIDQRVISCASCFLAVIAAFQLLLDIQGAVVRVPDASVAGPDWISQIRFSGGYGLLALATFFSFRSIRTLPVAALMVAIFLWGIVFDGDWRGEGLRERERLYGVAGEWSVLKEAIPRGSVVFWPNEVDRVWFELGTAAYANSAHTIGLIFSRGRTLALEERLERVALRVLEPDAVRSLSASGRLIPSLLASKGIGQGESNAVFGLNHFELTGELTASGLRRLCDDPVLDYVVDTSEVVGVKPYSTYTETLGGRHSKLFLYSCQDVF
ncbi:MAG: hypothetical protein H6943_09000 [Zoogloeaceae bacterium]|nr:hypothetical protein [Zoogloeaceae bacterium]